MIELIIITGVSGSGKSTALKAFEDLGYLSIDNFPIRLLPQFLEEIRESLDNKKVALVMDLRDKHFLSEYFNVLSKVKDKALLEVVFLEAKGDVLITRYNQTRRKHPLLEQAGSLARAIELEAELLKEIREKANLVLDTSNFNLHQLRNEIFKIYAPREGIDQAVVHFIAFGFKYGIPAEVNYLFDVRFLPNPYFEPELKNLTGKEAPIKEFLLSFGETHEYLGFLENFLSWTIPQHLKEGRRYLTIGIGCTGGRHRAPAIADLLKERMSLGFKGIKFIFTYRDIDKE
jgi:UPF0042 nucleotide-binding protein